MRGQVIVPTDMAQTAANMIAHERLYRWGFSAAVVVVVCNLPLGLILFELLKVVNQRLALLALVFISVAVSERVARSAGESAGQYRCPGNIGRQSS